MPFNFPSGRQLVTQILRDSRYFTVGRKIEPATDLARELLLAGNDRSLIDKFRLELHRSQTYSIDAFLERHPEFVEIGKVAIAAALLPKERPDVLFDTEDSWYRYLANSLLDNISIGADRKLAILTYNYDRSLEFYLYESLKSALNYSKEKMRTLFNRLQIVHLHGSFGLLPWQTEEDSTQVRVYGDGVNVVAAAEQIQIIHESIDNSAAYEEAWSCLNAAHRVAFLGFGYHRTNVRRLCAGGWLAQGRSGPVRGTCLGLQDGEKARCEELLKRCINLDNLDCHQFLRSRLELIR